MRENIFLASFTIVVLLIGFPSSVIDFNPFTQNMKVSAEELEENKQQQKSNDNDQEKREELEKKRAELKEKRDEIKQKQVEHAKKIAEKERKTHDKIVEKLKEIEELRLKADQLTAESSELEQKFQKKSDEIRQRLLAKIEQLETRTGKILEKIEQGKYFGPSLGKSDYINQYKLTFQNITATSIGELPETSNVDGFILLSTYDIGKHSLKFKVDECSITINSTPYSCGFGKARAVSSGTSGQKDSMVIIAFLEDGVINEHYTTLKIFLNAQVPIIEINEDKNQVEVHSPQSKIANQWFLGGIATLAKTGSTEIPVEDEPKHITIELKESVGISEQE